MNILPFEKQIAIIAALSEGCSIRSTERLTGVHRDTIMRLAARVGFGAIKFHDRTVHSLQVPRLNWSRQAFVAKKQRKVKPTMARSSATSTSFSLRRPHQRRSSVPGRQANEENTKAFIWDCASGSSTPRKSQPMRSPPMRAQSRSFGNRMPLWPNYQELCRRASNRRRSPLQPRSCSRSRPPRRHRRSPAHFDQLR